MKAIKTNWIVALLALFFVTGSVHAFAGGEVKELKIKTSAICDMCKTKIEHDMKFEKGVKKATLDVETKILTLQYRADKTTPEKLRNAVAKIGYDADDVKAVQKAYDKLPGCCKKGSSCDNDK